MSDKRTIAVTLDANLAPFQQRLNDAAGNVESFTKRVGASLLSINQSLNPSGGKLNDAISAGAVGALGEITSAVKDFVSHPMRLLTSAFSLAIKSVEALSVAAAGLTAVWVAVGVAEIKSLSELSKTASLLDMTAGNLARLQYAAKLADVDVEHLTHAMLVFQRGLATGGGKTADSFLVTIRGLQQIADAGERARAAFAVFHKDATVALKLAAMGEKDLVAAMREAGELGLVLTEREAAQIEEANTAVERMKAAFQGLGRIMSAVIAPILKASVDVTTDAIKWLMQYQTEFRRVGYTVEFIMGNIGGYFKLGTTYAEYFGQTTKDVFQHLYGVTLPAIIDSAKNLFASGWNVVIAYTNYAVATMRAKFDYWYDYLKNLFTYLFSSVLAKQIDILVGHLKRKIADLLYAASNLPFASGLADVASKILEPGELKQYAEMQEAAEQGVADGLVSSLNDANAQFIRDASDAMKGMGDAFRMEASGEAKDLLHQIEQQKNQLAGRMQSHVSKRELERLFLKKKNPHGNEDVDFSKDKEGNKAIEKGTQEALKIVAGRSEDKTLKKMDQQLAAANKQIQLLKDIAGKPGIAKANV